MVTSPNKLSQFWQELKRRNVVRVVTVYAGAAFVILELVDMSSEPFGLPGWTFILAAVLLSIGFIIAVILSWIYDIHPEEGVVKTEPAERATAIQSTGTSNGWKISSYISFLVILGLIAFNVFGGKRAYRIDESLAKSIAVLPFRNLSGDPGQDFICDGLTEEVINNLYKVKAFDRVPPVTTVLKYKNTEQGIPDIAEELQVNYILDPSYKKMEGMIRFTVTLIEARSEKQVWQENIDRQTDEISAIPSSIALQIADHLKAYITEPEKQRIQRSTTSNEDAYNAYLLGRSYQRKGGRVRNDNLASIEQFTEAISLDPNFAMAYTYLARAKLDRYWFSVERKESVLMEIKEFIENAIEIDPEQPDAYIIMAQYYYHGYLDYANALLQLEKASRFAPNHPEYLFLKALVVRRMGNLDQAIELFQAALNSDPLNYEYYGDLIETYAFIGKFEEAIKYSDKQIHIDPSNPLGYEIKTFTYLLQGDVSNAERILKECESLGVLQDVFDQAIYFTPFSLDIYTQQYKKALDYIYNSDWEGHFNLYQYQPKSLFQAQLYHWLNQPNLSRIYYDSTRIILEKALQDNSNDYKIIGPLGIAFAGLGNSTKAIEFGQKAVDLYSVDKDALGGLIRVADLAYIYVLLEEYDAALEHIEVLLSHPGAYSAALLKLDPIWSPLWYQPDFISLTEKYAK